MALKNYVFDLSNVSKNGSDGDISVKSGDQTLATASAAGISTTPVVIDGFGTFTFNTGKVTFKADAALPVGSYTVTTNSGGNHVSLAGFNASKASKGITLVADAAAEFVGTTGDDTVSITAGSASVRGGFGADTFVFGSGVASTVEDYKYSEGDVVSLGFSFSDIALDSIGTFTADTASVKADENNSEGLFYVDLNKNDGSKVLMATASGHKSEVSVTLSDKAGLVDVSAADTAAVVDLGTGSDTVKGADSTALTLKVGRADGNNSIATSLDANDTLQIISGDMGDIKATGSNVTIAATTLTGALNSTDDTYSVNVQFGSEAAKKLVYNLGGESVNYAADAGYYLGNGNGKLVVAANTASVDVDMAKSTSGIKGVDLTGAATDKDVNIVAKADTSIDASVAHAGKTWTFDLTASDSVAVNKLDLTSAAGKDVIKLSTTGGKDEITAFNASEDVLELSGVSEITKDTFSTANATNLVLKGGATITLTSAVGTEDIEIVVGDKTEKVAISNAATHNVTVGKDTTKVINIDNTVSGVNFVAAADDENGVGVVDLANSGVGKAQFIGEFGDVSVNTSAAAALVIGNGDANTITVTGDKSAVVWAGAKSDNNINLTGANAQDIVWTGSLDGKNTVTGFGDNDVVYVYDANLTAQDVASKLSVKSTGDVVFTTSDTASLTLSAIGAVGKTINVMGADEKGYKAVVGDFTGTNTVDFDKDASIFLTKENGTLKVGNTAVAEGTVTAIDLSGTLEGNDKLYVGVKNINASGSAGSFLLIGNNTEGASLTGGQNGNAIWGGGNTSQTMNGINGVTDIFWFGSQDGHDTVNNFETAKDVVFLYNATDISQVEVALNGTKASVIFSETGSTLSLGTVATDIGNVTFMLNDGAGAGTYKYYNYDADSKSFVEKK